MKKTKEEQLGCPRASPTRRKAGQSTEAGTNPTVIAKAESDDPAGNVTKEPVNHPARRIPPTYPTPEIQPAAGLARPGGKDDGRRKSR